MTPEEKLMEAIREREEELEEDDSEEDEGDAESIHHELIEKRRKRLKKKNRDVIDLFIGKGPRADSVLPVPWYYFKLYSWAVERYLKRDGWEVEGVLPYSRPSPVYTGVRTSDESPREAKVLVDGQLLAKKGERRVVLTMNRDPDWGHNIHAEGASEIREAIEEFLDSVHEIATRENLYRGRNLKLAPGIEIMEAGHRDWESVILPPDVKEDIRLNTMAFLRASGRLSEYGIPRKRGVILSGEPGTGKTIICKALMAEAGDDITCIVSSAYGMDERHYIELIYEIAADLSPSIVFLEDIDLIGQEREEFGYQRGAALISLLAELDGVEEQHEIVTVATTNSLDTLDSALNQRPSRFDRVVVLGKPSLQERRELVSRLCLKMPLGESIREYIARRSDGCTPAQVEEIIRSLVIEKAGSLPEADAGYLEVSTAEVDRAIGRIKGRNGHRIGFPVPSKNGGSMETSGIMNERGEG